MKQFYSDKKTIKFNFFRQLTMTHFFFIIGFLLSNFLVDHHSDKFVKRGNQEIDLHTGVLLKNKHSTCQEKGQSYQVFKQSGKLYRAKTQPHKNGEEPSDYPQ